MGRTRMIKPAFFKHAELYQAEHATGMPLRVAFAGLWTVADRAGRFRWKIDLKPDVLPYDEVDMMAVLDALEKHGFITSYVVDAKRYGFIPSFSEHQTFHKTERGSTLPPPLVNGESTVRYTADTVTVTGTVAVTELDVDDVSASVAGAVPPDPELTALFLTICANRAIAEKWGDQPNPLTPASAVSLTEALRNAGVDPHVARLSIYRQCRTSPQRVPPRSVNYFRKGIEQDWESEKARRALAVSSETPPPRETFTVTRGKASTGAGRAMMLLTQIRELVEVTQIPGRGTHRMIRKDRVAALGADVLAAYTAVGGSETILNTPPDKVSFLNRDFAVALEEAARVSA